MAARLGDGKALEDLVATIESLLVPQGFTVDKNWRVYNDTGDQIAELDIVVQGKVGSADYSCLIECRDRPSEGPAPGSWIEQLAARRPRFKFDKVMAVSTTGFAAGAVEYANSVGVDLREVHQVAPEMFSWLGMRTVHSQEHRHFLHDSRLGLSEVESEERVAAVEAAIEGRREDAPLLRSMKTGVVRSVLDAFVGAVSQNPSLWEGVVPNGPAKRLQVRIEYPLDDNHFVIDTSVGPVRIRDIDFDGDLSIRENEAPLSRVEEYRLVGKDEAVAQTASFVFPVKGQTISLDLHHLTESGQTHVAIRQMGTATTDLKPKPQNS